MHKVDILLAISLVGAFFVAATSGWLLIISETVTFVSVLLFEKRYINKNI